MKKSFLSIFILLVSLTNVSIMQSGQEQTKVYDLEKCTEANQILNLKVGDQITYSLNSTAPYPEKVIQVYYAANIAAYVDLTDFFEVKVTKPESPLGGTTKIVLTLKQSLPQMALPQVGFILNIERFKNSNRVFLVSNQIYFTNNSLPH